MITKLKTGGFVIFLILFWVICLNLTMYDCQKELEKKDKKNELYKRTEFLKDSLQIEYYKLKLEPLNGK